MLGGDLVWVMGDQLWQIVFMDLFCKRVGLDLIC